MLRLRMLLRSMRRFMMQSCSTARAQFTSGSFFRNGDDAAYDDDDDDDANTVGGDDAVRSFGDTERPRTLAVAAVADDDDDDSKRLLELSKRTATGCCCCGDAPADMDRALVMLYDALLLLGVKLRSSAIGRIARGAYKDARRGATGILLTFFTLRLLGPTLHVIAACCLSTALVVLLLLVAMALA